ncbi:MAG: GGDEF domain-containing protein [Vicinamibacteria bacterium]
MLVETLPKRRLYPVVGFFVALGAPAGLLILTGLVEGGLGSGTWIQHELQANALTYGYIAVSTAIMFVGLGFILGTNEDLLQRMSSTDPLTGLANRRLLDKRLREELARVDRYNHPLALMLLDLDGLKSVNDRRGHEAGDNAIKAVARTLQKTCRATDLAARLGGDEFAVLAPNITELEARTLAERVRRSLGMEASWVAVNLPPLTLSIGIADTHSVREIHTDRFFSAADRALYRAKSEGKDRVVLASAEDGAEDSEGVATRVSS